ncbi:hypothetical protein [Qipengyuania sp.]|uniref:hypothetical protein n=1 Tax=Qipengyuania sp. TaxID=2004515 RepID=UPI0035C84D24
MSEQIDLRSAQTERSDVLAYLARRRANCELVARKSPEFADGARVQMRQLDVLIDEIRGGMHEGEAQAAASRPTAEEAV